jgi:hypothetical protein
MENRAFSNSSPGQPSSEICCPNCGSTQITASQKGYSGGMTLAVGFVFGGLGVLRFPKSSRTIYNTCQQCGNQWMPGQLTGRHYRRVRKFTVSTWKWIKIMSIIMIVITGLIDFILLILPKYPDEGMIWTIWGMFLVLTLMFISLARTAQKEIFLQKKENQKRYFGTSHG